MIETPQAVIDVAEIAASPRLAVLVMGINDLAAGLGVDLAPGREALIAALSRDRESVDLEGGRSMSPRVVSRRVR